MRIKDWLERYPPLDGEAPADRARRIVREARKFEVRLNFSSVRSEIFKP
jgi:hypothetical protein